MTYAPQIDARVAALQQALGLKADEAALLALIATVATKAGVAAYDTLNAAIALKADGSALAALALTVANKAATVDLSALAAIVAGKADLAVITAALALKADTSAVNLKADQTALVAGLSGKVDTTALTALTAIVSGKASAVDLAALTTTVGTKADATAVSAALAGKASQASVDAIVAQLAAAPTQYVSMSPMKVADLIGTFPPSATTSGKYARVSDLYGSVDDIMRCRFDGTAYRWVPQRTEFVGTTAATIGAIPLVPLVTAPTLRMTATALTGNVTLAPSIVNAYIGLRMRVIAPSSLPISTYTMLLTGLVGTNVSLLAGSEHEVEYGPSGWFQSS